MVRKSGTGPPVDGVRITSMTVSSGRCPEPDGYDDPDPLSTDGPEISAAYEVTNEGTEAFTYTIRFTYTTDTRQGLGSTNETVRSLGPDATVRGTVRLGTLHPDACPMTNVRVAEVTKVPVTEAPPEPGECPPSGVRLTSDSSGAMGLRVVGLRLENCGTRDYTLDGYPILEPLDKDRSVAAGVQIVRGSGGIRGSTPGSGFDEPALPLVLKPGESAVSGFMWRMDSVILPYIRVRAQRGADPVTLTLHLDLGTTGKLAVRAWTRPPN